MRALDDESFEKAGISLRRRMCPFASPRPRAISCSFLLASIDCVSQEEEDLPEEKERLADSLEALEILKAYTSPWPVDADDGRPSAVDAGGSARVDNTGTPKGERREVLQAGLGVPR